MLFERKIFAVAIFVHEVKSRIYESSSCLKFRANLAKRISCWQFIYPWKKLRAWQFQMRSDKELDLG